MMENTDAIFVEGMDITRGPTVWSRNLASLLIKQYFNQKPRPCTAQGLFDAFHGRMNLEIVKQTLETNIGHGLTKTTCGERTLYSAEQSDEAYNDGSGFSRTQTSDTGTPPALVPLMEVDMPFPNEPEPSSSSGLTASTLLAPASGPKHVRAVQQFGTPPPPQHVAVQKNAPNSIILSAHGNMAAFTVSSPDEVFKCVICGYLANTPTICGNTDICSATFCEDCLLSHLGSSTCCSVCEGHIPGGKPRGSKALKDAMGKLLFHCPHSARNAQEQNRNKENGAAHAGGSGSGSGGSGKKRSAQDCHECTWTGPLDSLSSHLKDQCQREPVPCRNPGCGQLVPRGELEEHTQNCPCRLEECEYCKTRVPHQALEPHYRDDCTKIHMTCELCGDDELTRDQLEHHMEVDCPERMMTCAYASFGCTCQFRRGDEESHNQVSQEYHLRLVSHLTIKLADAHAKSEKARKKFSQEQSNALRVSKLAHAITADKLRALEVTSVWRANVGEMLKQLQKHYLSLNSNGNGNSNSNSNGNGNGNGNGNSSSTNFQLNLSRCPGGPAPASGEQQGSSEEEEGRLAYSADFNVEHGSGGVSCIWMALTVNVKTNELSVSLFKRAVVKPVILSSSSACAGTKSKGTSKGKKRKSTQPAVQQQQQQQHGSTSDEDVDLTGWEILLSYYPPPTFGIGSSSGASDVENRPGWDQNKHLQFVHKGKYLVKQEPKADHPDQAPATATAQVPNDTDTDADNDTDTDEFYRVLTKTSQKIGQKGVKFTVSGDAQQFVCPLTGAVQVWITRAKVQGVPAATELGTAWHCNEEED